MRWLIVGCALTAWLQAGPRDGEWKKVEEAGRQRQPKTQRELLGKIEQAAFAEKAWPEGTRALVRRAALEGRVGAIRALDAELEKAPEATRPWLRAISAWWLADYYSQNRWSFMGHSRALTPTGDSIETWDVSRVLAEIDRRFQLSLADAEVLKKSPAADYSELLKVGDLDKLADVFRPTLYDVVAHSALDFYAQGEVAAARPMDHFEIAADLPALGPLAEFLKWQPEPAELDSPLVRTLRIFQQLLEFHRADADPSALLLVDLERLRWAGRTAVGDDREARAQQALENFIAEHASHPLSAWARESLGEMLVERGDPKAAHAVLAAGAQAFAQHPFGKLCTSGMAELEAQTLAVVTELQWTPAGETIHVEHRNLKRVWFRIYPKKFDPAKMDEDREGLPEGDGWVAAKLQQAPLRAWSEALVDAEDFQVRQARLAAPKDLPDGDYVLMASAAEDFPTKRSRVAVTTVRVTGLALMVRTAYSGGLEGFVTDAVTGAPLAGIAIDVWPDLKKPRNPLKTVTDQAGAYRPSQLPGDRQALVVASRGTQRSAAFGYWWEGHPEKPEPALEVTFFTDRAIYRPGQTVHFKGIVGRIDQANARYETVAKRAGMVSLHDANRQELAQVAVTTNAYGSFSGTFTAPENGRLGPCEITLDDLGGTGRIRVEEYKRPKFAVKIEGPKAAVALGQQVGVRVVAEGYTGAPVDGAKVAWRVTRAARVPNWQKLSGWARPAGGWEEEIGHGVAETDAAGTVAVTFEAKPNSAVKAELEPVFDFMVSVDVTDGAGETHSAKQPVSVAYTRLKAEISTDEWLEAGTPLAVKVHTDSHDGTGMAANGTLKIFRLKEPAVCPQPDTSEENLEEGQVRDHPSAYPKNWELGEVVQELPVATGPDGLATLKPVLAAGAYQLGFETRDAGGRLVRAWRGVQVLDPAATEFPTRMPFFTCLRSDQVEPGNPVVLLWGSGHQQARACVEWYRDNVLLKREWSAEGRTQQVFSFPVEEQHRGGLTIAVFQVTLNRLHEVTENIEVEVPWTNKELKLHWEHLVSKLEPGAKEIWTAVVEGPGGEAAAAEMVATLYDASLDDFVRHYFDDLTDGLASDSTDTREWSFSSGARLSDDHFEVPDDPRAYELGSPFRDFRSELGLSPYRNWSLTRRAHFGPDDSIADRGLLDGRASPYHPPELPNSIGSSNNLTGVFPVTPATPAHSPDADMTEAPQPEVAALAMRANLQETAFFFPDLVSDADGKVRMTFTMPEALTKWRFLGMAHDREMRSGVLEGEAVTAKNLMVQPNPPRFLREGDAVWFTVKVSNRGTEPQTGTARLTLLDAATDGDKTAAIGIAQPEQEFMVPAKESRTLKWRLTVPEGAGFLRYKAVATSGALSDGEEGWLPVISRRILVTESLSLPVRDAGTKTFEFTKLLQSTGSPTLENRSLNVQVVSQPAWYAVMALPYLMEFPHECAEQIFNRYYANALVQYIAGSDPEIRRIFEQWQNGKALDSPLEKNAEINGILLEETPWLREAKDESAARRRVGLLFDGNHTDREQEQALAKLTAMQETDGLWPWFPGGPGDPYISLYVATGFARLRSLGIATDVTPALKALTALDRELSERYEDLRKRKVLDQMNLDPWMAHYLYTRTFFLKDKALRGDDKPAFDYFVKQARGHWAELDSRMSRAQVALALKRLGEVEVPKLVTRSLKENGVVSEELGMFWKDAGADGWWWQAPVETQAMMIEAFREIDQDAKAVEDCQVWLLKQKQVQDWQTTKATADAIYALLKGGRNLLGSDSLLQVSLGGVTAKPEAVEAGTGFYESRFTGDAVKAEQGKIEVTKSDAGVSWASVHWQYLEDIAKVTGHQGGEALKLEKSLFIRKNSDQGPVLVPVDGPVKVGDELVTRLVLKNDRAMEYVHLKDLRGSGTEPVNVLSGYRRQDGFGYYEVTRDTASHFFIDRLPAGTHVFETSVRVQLAGAYQTGIAEIRCMYAPEFNAHSGSVGIQAE